jgi:RHS repeat-associated protein
LKEKNGVNMVFDLVDDFTYSYSGNQLLYVRNAVNTPTLHTGNSFNYMVGNPQDDYYYNENGSLITDPRKKISAIGYNHLNLPIFVCDTSEKQNYIINLYDAVGIKLRKRILENGQIRTQYDYISGNVYKDNVLEFVPTGERRVIFENNVPIYEYHYKDHLGNLRVAFREANSQKWIATAELSAQSTESTEFANVNQTRRDKPQYLGEKACQTRPGQPLGWWKSISVQKGDVIFATAEAYFEKNPQIENTALNWNMFLFLNPNYALNNGENMLNSNNNLVGIGILPTFGGNNAEIPKAYLIAQFYNADNQPTQQKILYVTTNNYAWNTLGEIQEIALENGRVEIFVANESNTGVFFDDLSIYKSPTPIVQENHYYPFGMNLVGIEKEGTPNHRFQFMSKEKESSFGLGWTETDWRGYDGQVGRFWQVDKLAEQAPDWTGYRYGFNNPISNTDPSGLWEVSANGGMITHDLGEITSFLNQAKSKPAKKEQNSKHSGEEERPIFDTNGQLLGTDENGIQGEAIVMDKANFKQGMSEKEALKHNKGVDSFKPMMRKYFDAKFQQLKTRPDYDGYITLAEANDQEEENHFLQTLN